MTYLWCVAMSSSLCTLNSSVLSPLDQIASPECQEQKIHNMDTIVDHYITSHACPLQQPPLCHQVKQGDIYIHQYDEGKLQTWLWEHNKWLRDVKDGYHHPTLPGYQLYISAGVEPTWIMKKTRIIYKDRTRAFGKGNIMQQ